MTTTVDAAARRRPAILATLRQLYTIVLRMQLTPLRTLAVAALGAIGVLLGFLTGRDDDPLQATVEMIGDYGITVAIPLCILWLATSSVGDLIDDGLLVYLWLKPVARWQLPAARSAVARTGSSSRPVSTPRSSAMPPSAPMPSSRRGVSCIRRTIA